MASLFLVNIFRTYGIKMKNFLDKYATGITFGLGIVNIMSFIFTGDYFQFFTGWLLVILSAMMVRDG